MKIFLDTASIADITWATSSSLIDGVTTNPTLMAEQHAEGEPRAHLAEICRLVAGPVFAGVAVVDADGLYREGRELAKIADNVVVTIPMLEDGIATARRLSSEGIRVNLTLVFSVAQALIAAKAGASSVSAFMGRLEETGHDGATLLRDIREVFDTYDLDCEILASSIRTPAHFIQSAKSAADAAAVPTAVLKSLLLHPLTDLGVDQYLNDWSKRIAKSRAST